MSRGPRWALGLGLGGLVLVLACCAVAAFAFFRTGDEQNPSCPPLTDPCESPTIYIVNGHDEPVVVHEGPSVVPSPALSYQVPGRPGGQGRPLGADCAGTRYRATSADGRELGTVVLESCRSQTWQLLPDGTTRLVDGADIPLPSPLPS